MVTRKPVGPRVSTSQANNASQDTANPPYPATPLDSNKIPGSTNSIYSPNLGTSPAFDLIDMQEAQNRPRRDSDVSSHGTWDSPDEDDRETPDENELPPPLRIAPGKQKAMQNENGENKHEELPASLRPGPTGGASAPLAARSQDGGINYQEEAQSNPWSQTQRPQEQPEQPNGRFESNNPYLNTQQTGSAPASRPDSEHIPPSQDQQHLAWQQTAKNYTPWGASANPPPPINPPPDAPAELPAVHTPADELSKMSLGAPPYPSSDEPPSVPETTPKSRIQEPPLSAITERTESVASVNPWEQPTPEQKWDDHAAVPPPAPPLPSSSAQSPPYPQEDGVPQVPPVPHTNHGHSLIDDDETPATTLFQQRTASPPKPERNVPAPIDVSHPATTASQSIPANPETPRTQASRQRNEHYPIKHINWKDQSGAMRQSPILMQNANGPCPLLALVNALVLSTPPSLDTALVEALRTREQVSLGLLLDAVFDELMSGRRGDSAQELPDVSELYSFLLALHTGMNVNPRFITPVHAPRGSLDGHSPDLNQTHPMHRAQSKAGAFEETKEMRLYSTFSIPLIHGWVPAQDTGAYAAFERSAQSFEDAQNIQFLEFELEDKLRAEGLSDQEQLALQDIQVIKSFLSSWPTQLTDHGLSTISKTLRPGQIAILFRNDHFSTVYKEPSYGGLMTLVTDAGYGSHDEIVWESLVDVNGAASELFSGDFRVVSHSQDASRPNQASSAGANNDGWQTVPPSRNSRPDAQAQQPSTNAADLAPPLPGPRPTSSHSPANPSPQPATHQPSLSEQEDHDLALALQLQEEEEDRQRQAESQRRREQELSEQYLSRQNEGRPPAIPPRRSGNGARPPSSSGGPRPAANRPEAGAGGGGTGGDPTAPPTYEQAANDRPYREGGAAGPNANANATQLPGHPLNTYDALRRQQQNQQQQQQGGRRVSGRRRSSLLGGAPPGGFPAASGGQGMGAGQGGHGGRRPHAQPGTVQEAEERCVVM